MSDFLFICEDLRLTLLVCLLHQVSTEESPAPPLDLLPLKLHLQLVFLVDRGCYQDVLDHGHVQLPSRPLHQPLLFLCQQPRFSDPPEPPDPVEEPPDVIVKQVDDISVQIGVLLLSLTVTNIDIIQTLKVNLSVKEVKLESEESSSLSCFILAVSLFLVSEN